MTLLLSEHDVRSACDIGLLVEAIEKASVSEDAAGGPIMPPRVNLHSSSNFLRVMPVILPASGILGLKSFHGSMENGVRYLLKLARIDDGQILALVDCAYLTAARTGATTGVAARHLSRPDSVSVGLIGSGLEAETNLLGVAAVRPLREVRVFSRSRDRRTGFAERMAGRLPGVSVRAVDSAPDAVRGVDIVVVATNTGSGGPVAYRGEWAEPGQTILSIGSTSPFLRELDTATFHRADAVVVDTGLDHMAEESGDVMALRAEDPAWSRAHMLVDVVTGRTRPRTDDREILLFKSVGTAAQDLVGGMAVYTEAVRRGIGTTVPDVAELKRF
ncbi:ornithine cyclodeaminase family protein [Acrocarpospora macrocephala]|uniref:Ornithine cyclodeaminase n=1 Tax=Acrocarpospora macrocephala TaxID=150177 RepID=A0A5M3WLT1_9ACTN|nr:ornithine cyclodeaminase family protein [Acrocarpospora macrocephala]GES09596.1 ornithine cyclodeaminase [Acrocarpospora macrocephala]